MSSIGDLRELVERRGVRCHERRAILSDLEQGRIEELRERMQRAVEEVRRHARQLREALE